MEETVDAYSGPFRFEYDPAVLRYGANCVTDLGDELATRGLERALVVCGSTVGETAAVIDPVREGLGDRLAGVFAETTPAKRLGTAYDALERFEATDADAVVSLGGGSSLDVAKVLSVLAATDEAPETVGAAFEETGTLSIPEEGLPPVVAVPTTLAGADLSIGAGVTADPTSCPVERPVSGGISHRSLMPAAVCYDPELLATTPQPILAASAMNGFDKGIETLYAGTATPVTDATAMRGLELFVAGLEALGEGETDLGVYAGLTKGIMLLQYGIARPDATTLSLVHAFGHGLTRTYDVQQGAAHAVVAPRVLEYVFAHVDGRRALLAEALGVGDATDPAAAVVERVETLVDALELPTRLRDVDGPEPAEFGTVAEAVLDDAFVANRPPGLEPTREDVEGILEAAW
ncbi:iron-containing alcohol dehydrogenase family protein [Halomicroarcula sp. GCM10025817]|uniref:iron-containing alcohol dehydrogenase family protein n=1 Tax=Haloarcula TaxID=2237 RepID=UPI0023E78EA0|nr:iron-containing alcohol dehydrogenase family protein [Halomicroarcula sp. SYNS111]